MSADQAAAPCPVHPMRTQPCPLCLDLTPVAPAHADAAPVARLKIGGWDCANDALIWYEKRCAWYADRLDALRADIRDLNACIDALRADVFKLSPPL